MTHCCTRVTTAENPVLIDQVRIASPRPIIEAMRRVIQIRDNSIVEVVGPRRISSTFRTKGRPVLNFLILHAMIPRHYLQHKIL